MCDPVKQPDVTSLTAGVCEWPKALQLDSIDARLTVYTLHNSSPTVPEPTSAAFEAVAQRVRARKCSLAACSRSLVRCLHCWFGMGSS